MIKKMDNHISAGSERTLNIPKDILDDLSSRFIINVPEEERGDLIRVFFQIELAHWFYLDFNCVHHPNLPPCSMREFGRIILNHIPSLRQYASKIDILLQNWKSYKMNVPTFGAILLNKNLDKVLLVQAFRGRSSWGFPRGKVNKEEDPKDCAVREVYEETGYDISDKINKNQYIENHFNDQLIRLYIVTGISEDIKFEPQTRNEIKDVSWFLLADLPGKRKVPQTKTVGISSNYFFMVIPFIRKLKQWIEDQQITSHGDSNSSSDPTNDDEKFDPHFKSSNKNTNTKEQQLFAQLQQNELSKYALLKSPSKSSTNHRTMVDTRQEKKPLIAHSIYNQNKEIGNEPYKEKKLFSRQIYTPPPRFQKLSKNVDVPHTKIQLQNPEPKKNTQNKPTNEIFITRRPLFQDDTAKCDSQHFRCTAWDKFQLDTTAMIACFNINLRNPDLMNETS